MKIWRLSRNGGVCIFLGIALIGLGVSSIWGQAVGSGENDPKIARQVVAYLERGHLRSVELDDAISRKFFASFIKDFDPTKMYFLKSDIDEFKTHEVRLDDQVSVGDLSFAILVKNRFIQRIKERLPIIDELLEAEHDFGVDEELSTNYDQRQFAETAEALRESWRLRIKRDLLLERIADEPLAPDEQKKKIRRRYQRVLSSWEQLESDELLEIFLTSLTTVYDPHTTYMSPSTVDDFNIIMSLQLEGIGARLRAEDGYTIVDAIIAGGAADRHGKLQVGDRIIGVDPDGDPDRTGKDIVDVIDMKLGKVVKYIRGKRDTKVLLRVLKAGQEGKPVDYVITRDRIELKESEAKGRIIEQDNGTETKLRIGYIDLPSFYTSDITAISREGGANVKKCSTDVRRILGEFNNKGVDGVILDLRSNGGGALGEAIDLTGLFLDKGAIVQVKKGRDVRYHRDQDPATIYDGPLIVLVSRLSASASEILAGAIQDYERGLIVGDEATHGKGTVQTVVDLGRSSFFRRSNDMGALKLTIQQFYRVNGDSTQARGVRSDVVLPSLIGKMEIGEETLPEHLPFERVDPVEHRIFSMVSPQIVQELQSKSKQRRAGSEEFLALESDIERMLEAQKRKRVTLNETKLRAEIASQEKQRAALEEKFRPSDEKEKKFPRSFYDKEVLMIMQDYLKLLTNRNTASR